MQIITEMDGYERNLWIAAVIVFALDLAVIAWGWWHPAIVDAPQSVRLVYGSAEFVGQGLAKATLLGIGYYIFAKIEYNIRVVIPSILVLLGTVVVLWRASTLMGMI